MAVDGCQQVERQLRLNECRSIEISFIGESSSDRMVLIPGPPSASYFLVGGKLNAWQRSSWGIPISFYEPTHFRSKRSTAKHFFFLNVTISQLGTGRPRRRQIFRQSHSFSTLVERSIP